MTKLTKAPPPAYPAKSNTPGSLATAVPYESLRQQAQPPVPVTTAVLPSSYNDPLPDTNPFSPNFRPDSISNNAQVPPLSPVSLVAGSPPLRRLSEAPVQAPKPQRPAELRKSVNLRRLDGTPYESAQGGPEKEKPKTVKVAKDMHDGALPPVYKPQATDAIISTGGTTSAAEAQTCAKCGKKAGTHGTGHSCNHCDKRRTTGRASTTSTTAPAPVHAPSTHARAFSESQTSHSSSRMSEQSTAGPSSSPTSSTHTRCCTKCGRYKRPSSEANPFDQGRPNGSGPARAPVPMAAHPAMRPSLTIQPNAPANNAVYPKIDVIPPSAATSRAVNSPFSVYGDDSPLVGQAKKAEFRLFRNSSLVRSLSRRLSKKDKNVAAPAPLPSQQLARQSGEQSAGNLINMISNAMQGPVHERDGQYSKLAVDRPETPFSFVGGKDEADGFEMVNIRGDRASVSSHDSWSKEPIAPQISVTHSDSDMYAGIPQDHIDVAPRPRSTGPQRLAVDDVSRPPITRFKSLRVGVQRMGSGVSRSTSLKRLGSLKTVHHAWYVEGSDGNNENIIPAF
ncbi:hypothetical protein A1O7_04750 [Cladophialophora yegresii CBS 114405]|uniref:Uncharacterized protein n=1 Tax=Cladophialophora yegresii CBS 114405 TaxID=1182544 RepID=W9VXM9_9EURO|nr:uncharacterized protein A1O7_04750 [Cladophialophora yegresii CBS 114405]EXJ60597.1 hypothetical protein A1O7_04750 [Cladophialophora yegresii CBS 114405]